MWRKSWLSKAPTSSEEIKKDVICGFSEFCPTSSVLVLNLDCVFPSIFQWKPSVGIFFCPLVRRGSWTERFGDTRGWVLGAGGVVWGGVGRMRESHFK